MKVAVALPADSILPVILPSLNDKFSVPVSVTTALPVMFDCSKLTTAAPAESMLPFMAAVSVNLAEASPSSLTFRLPLSVD
ncbi:hypothetical protein D3C80_1714340 [compost metagenome]